MTKRRNIQSIVLPLLTFHIILIVFDKFNDLVALLLKRLQENQVHSVKLLFDQGNILSIKEKKNRQGKGRK